MLIQLGHTGISTSALALGCARLGSALTPLGRKECIALIEEAFSLGVRHFDTASIYGQGDSERYIGEALRKHRSEVCLSSKAGQRLTSRQALMAAFKTPIRWMASRRRNLHEHVAVQRERGVPRCFDPDYIESSLMGSLRRLKTDHLDIFYLHSPDAAVLQDAPLMARIEKLRAQGLFRAFGVSCDDHALARVAALHDAVQVVQFAFDESPACKQLMDGLASSGKSAVLRGLMQIPSSEHTNGDALSRRMNHALHLPATGGVIVGTTSVKHLRENAAAFERAIAMGQAR